MNKAVEPWKLALRDVADFAEAASGLRLRAYQVAAARAIVDSVLRGRGLSFVVMFPRQSGKNELQAQIETYLLVLLSRRGAEMVKISPTWQPQSINAMRRLERVLARNQAARDAWVKESGYIYRIGAAQIAFLSGAPESNIVGATAATLLQVDEAQDVQIAKYDREIAPMAASTNATRVFWGTAWTDRTLLARELRAARAAEQRERAQNNGAFTQRAFVLTADEVAAEVPAYGAFVAGQVARLGRASPMVRTQYYSEELDGGGGMFPPWRIALLRGDGREQPAGSGPYALLVDVGGEGPASERRDATVVTVVAVDRSSTADPRKRAPTYRAAARYLWVGTPHAALYEEIRALAAAWTARWVVVDATGVGAGLASFLERALPGRVIPFTFTQASKSRLGWAFLAIVDGGRWLEGTGAAVDPLAAAGRLCAPEIFFQQLSFTTYEVLPGPGKVLKWGVPEGARDPATGAPVHDDLVLSAALCAVLDEQEWGPPPGAQPGIIPAADPLDGMKGF